MPHFRALGIQFGLRRCRSSMQHGPSTAPCIRACPRGVLKPMRSDIPPGSRLELIPYSRVFPLRPGLDEYAERLATSLPRDRAIETLSALSVLHYDDLGDRSVSEQRRRLAMIGPHSPAPWFKAVENFVDQGGVLIHRHGLGMMMRLVLLHTVNGPSTNDFAGTLVKLMLVVNELFGSHQGLVDADTSDEDLIDVELLGAIVPECDTTSILARPFSFLRWFDKTNKQDLDNWVDVRADFARLLAIPVDEYLVATVLFVLYLVGATGRLAQRTYPVIRISDLERSFRHPATIRHWIARFVTPLESIRGELLSSARDYSAASLIPFLRHPVISIDGDIIVCPLPATLDNLLGAGFYFTLFDAYKKNDEEANAQYFASMYGRFFEDYVATLLERVVDPATESISPESKYMTPQGESRSSDFLLLDTSYRLVLVEVVKTRLNLLTTLVNRDRKSLAADIRRIVGCNMKQITRTLRDLKSGFFRFPVRHDELKGTYALIVAGQRLPGLYGVNTFAQGVLDEAGSLSDVRTVHLMDVDELEILAAEHYHALPFGELLERKAQHHDRYARVCRLQSFIDTYSGIEPARRRIVSPDFDAFFDEVFEPMLKAWGLRD